jgi:gag-polyprotein putative aspartyl protease
MTRILSVNRVLGLLIFAFTLSAIANSPDENTTRISFTTADQFLVVVPVSINGAGPFNFLLDTGTTNTDIDQVVADQLSLPRVGEHEVTAIQGKLHLSIAHAESISIAGATVRDLNVNVLSHTNVLPSKVHGILGEDFLSQFDLLIDNQHHVVELQSGHGQMSEMFDGERLPVELEGIMQGQYVNHIIIITATKLGNKPIKLLVDSGVNYLYFFGGPESLGFGAIERECALANLSSPSKHFAGYSNTIPQLRFGNKKLSNLPAIAQQRIDGMDTDGLMPTSAFHSIFISHSQRFIILDPSWRITPFAQDTRGRQRSGP